MIGKMLDLVFGCHHRQMTRPITPVHRHKTQPSATYVVCLECGKQFYYDTANMRLGMPVPVSVITPDRGSFQSQF
jgi:hypothetical protein